MMRSMSVEQAIRAHVAAGAPLLTPTGRATFTVRELNDSGLVLLLGPKQTPTALSWECLEGVLAFLREHGDWVRVGADRNLPEDPDARRPLESVSQAPDGQLRRGAGGCDLVELD